MELSIIIPIRDEEESIKPLYFELKDVLDSLTLTYEIIFVENCSTDSSVIEIEAIKLLDKNVWLFSTKGKGGKSEALMVGFKRAAGKYIMTMDGDLQDVPGEIPKFLNKIKDYDMVTGWKQKRKDPTNKLIASKIANKVTNLIARTKVHDMNCGFKLYRRKVIKDLDLKKGFHRYIPMLLTSKGYKIGEVKVKHRKRKYGKSKYGVSRLFRGFYDLIRVLMITKKSFFIYLWVGAFVTILNIFLLWLLIDKFHIPTIISSSLVVGGIFFLKFWIYKITGFTK